METLVDYLLREGEGKKGSVCVRGGGGGEREEKERG